MSDAQQGTLEGAPADDPESPFAESEDGEPARERRDLDHSLREYADGEVQQSLAGWDE